MRTFLSIFGFNVAELLQFAAGAFAFALLSYLTYRSLKPAYFDRCGWFWVKPALMHHFALIGSAAFSSLMWWLYLFVGSARADAAKQEFAMLLLAVAFGIGCLGVWWVHYANTVSWKGSVIRTCRFGAYKYNDLRNLVDIKEVSWRNQWRLEFSDGSNVYVSDTTHGFEELGEHIERVLASSAP